MHTHTHTHILVIPPAEHIFPQGPPPTFLSCLAGLLYVVHSTINHQYLTYNSQLHHNLIFFKHKVWFCHNLFYAKLTRRASIPYNIRYFRLTQKSILEPCVAQLDPQLSDTWYHLVALFSWCFKFKSFTLPRRALWWDAGKNRVQTALSAPEPGEPHPTCTHPNKGPEPLTSFRQQ